MGQPHGYRRRRPSLLRNLWVYRRLVGAAMVLGLLLWFVVINSAQVTVYFPFRLGQVTSSVGVILLLGALAGSLATGLILTLVLALRRLKAQPAERDAGDDGANLPDDRPPADYAAKAKEGFPDAGWSAR
jgi:uncharacterized integral membrane protein